MNALTSGHAHGITGFIQAILKMQKQSACFPQACTHNLLGMPQYSEQWKTVTIEFILDVFFFFNESLCILSFTPFPQCNNI